MNNNIVCFINKDREYIINYMNIGNRDVVKFLDYLNKVHIKEHEVAGNFDYQLITIIDKGESYENDNSRIVYESKYKKR